MASSSVFSSGPSEVAAQNVWHKSVDILKSQLDPQIFAAWIKPLGLAQVNQTADFEDATAPAEVELVAPNKFCCDHVRRHYHNLISDTLNDVMGRENVVVHFKVREEGSLPIAGAPNAGAVRVTPAAFPRRQEPRPVDTSRVPSSFRSRSTNVAPRPSMRRRGSCGLNPKYNFSNFVVGSCNQLPYTVGLRVAENLGTQFNPLFVYGGVGLGKTHLVNAIGNAAMRRGKNVLLVSSEVFVNELIASLRSNTMDKFKSKFRSLDLLIVDDIQFIIGKERTQEEFFHTFNDLYNRHRQIVVTAEKIPQELSGLEERLRTRFASGITADLQAPDFETRVAILAKKAESLALELHDEAAQLIAESIDTNVRELEGALNQLQALSSLHAEPGTVDLAREALRSFVTDRAPEITPEKIQRLVAERFNVGISDLLGKRRTHNIAFARHVAMYLCRELTPCSYPEIGLLFGGRDHSTVIHARRVIETRLEGNQKLKTDIDVLKRRLKSEP